MTITVTTGSRTYFSSFFSTSRAIATEFLPWATSSSISGVENLQGSGFGDVLLGSAEPGGRLPQTWPLRLEDTVAFGDPAQYPGVDGHVRYDEGVFIGPNVSLTNDLRPRSRQADWTLTPTRIREGATIGANATILPGRTIGQFAMVGGIALGTAIALMRLSGKKWLVLPAAFYVNTLRSIPLVMVILWFFLLIPLLIGRPLGAELSAMVTFTVFEAAYYSEIMRAGIQSVPSGQVSAGYAVGMTYAQCMKLIVLPQAFRNMLPVLLTQTIILFQDVSLVYVLSMPDFLGAANLLLAQQGPDAIRFGSTPVDAAAYKFSIERIPAVSGPNPTTIYVRRVKETKIVDDHTVHIVTDGPAPILPNDFIRLFIVSHKVAAGLTKETANEAFNSGKAAVGIEIPNRVKQIVSFKEIVLSQEFQQGKDALVQSLPESFASVNGVRSSCERVSTYASRRLLSHSSASRV